MPTLKRKLDTPPGPFPKLNAMTRIRQTLIIATTPRTDSNYLCELLLTTWACGWPAEWFNPATITDFSEKLGLPSSPSLLAYRDAIIADRHSPNGSFSFKIMWDHLLALFQRLHQEGSLDSGTPSLDALDALFPNIRFLHLYREDVLGQAISHVRAQISGEWILRDQNALQQRRDKELPYEFQRLNEAVLEIQAMHQAWSRFLQPASDRLLEISYESLLDDLQGSMKRIRDFLAIPAHAFHFRAPDNILIQRDDLSQAWRSRFLADQATQGSNV